MRGVDAVEEEVDDVEDDEDEGEDACFDDFFKGNNKDDQEGMASMICSEGWEGGVCCLP